MRIVFFGTGDIALPSFHWLLKNNLYPIALVTQPDKPAGRKLTLTPPKIKLDAIEAGIPVIQAESMRADEAIEQIMLLTPDIIVVMAYGQILTEKLISCPKIACINLHASLLPRYRGAACIQAALDAGNQETGITAIHVIRQLDAGAIITKKAIPIFLTDTGESMHDRLAELAPSVLAEAFIQLKKTDHSPTPQDPILVSHIGKLNREDGRINWNQSAEIIERRIRAYHSWPGTFTVLKDQSRLKIFPFADVNSDDSLHPGVTKITPEGLLVGCKNSSLLIREVQSNNSKRMSALDFVRGQREIISFD
jgi:methionyl-tRNA formyltransferase